LSDYTKVLASFANVGGGVIIFGVSNHPRRIVGAKGMADEADWANRLRDDFDPEIPVSIREYQLGAFTIFAVGGHEQLVSRTSTHCLPTARPNTCAR
jgi:predicted HTH transcriptional regulator